jgi:hypothetical protein
MNNNGPSLDKKIIFDVSNWQMFLLHTYLNLDKFVENDLVLFLQTTALVPPNDKVLKTFFHYS